MECVARIVKNGIGLLLWISKSCDCTSTSSEGPNNGTQSKVPVWFFSLNSELSEEWYHKRIIIPNYDCTILILYPKHRAPCSALEALDTSNAYLCWSISNFRIIYEQMFSTCASCSPCSPVKPFYTKDTPVPRQILWKLNTCSIFASFSPSIVLMYRYWKSCRRIKGRSYVSRCVSLLKQNI